MSLLDDLVSAVEAGGVLRVYKLNEVPANPAYPYAVVGLGSPQKVWRTTNGAAGDLAMATAQFFSHDIDGALDIATLGDLDGQFISGRLVSREAASPPYRDPDDEGVVTISHAYQL